VPKTNALLAKVPKTNALLAKALLKCEKHTTTLKIK